MNRTASRTLPALLVFLGTAGLYFFTSARSPGWVDATLILEMVRRLDLGAWVNNHNLFLLLGHGWLLATPYLDPHRSIVLLCALLGSITVLLLYLTAEEVTASRAAAALTAAAMALSQSLWWHSTTIEVYTLNTALIGAILLLVFRFLRRGGTWRLFAAFFAFGLGVSNHVLMGLYVAAFALLLVLLVVRRRLRAWQVIVALLCFAAGASLFLVIFFASVAEVARMRLAGSSSPAASVVEALAEVLGAATGGGFRSMMFPRGLPGSLRLFWRINYVALLLWNFPSAAIVFAALGLPRLWRMPAGRTGAAFFLAGLALQVGWSANYLIWDMYAFSLPVYVMLAVPMAMGIDAFIRAGGLRRGRWAVFLTFAVPLALYPSLAHWPARERTVDWYISQYPESVRLSGFWDPAEYVFNPSKRNYWGVQRFAAAWAARLPPGAHYWDDESKAAYPLRFYYQNVRGVRRDVDINIIFGLLMTEPIARDHARAIAGQLDDGDPVYIAAIVEPEREILNQLFHLEAPETGLEEIRAMDARELARRFPRTRIEEFPLTGDRSLMIYRLRR